jgi:hypothetical protein
MKKIILSTVLMAIVVVGSKNKQEESVNRKQLKVPMEEERCSKCGMELTTSSSNGSCF